MKLRTLPLLIASLAAASLNVSATPLSSSVTATTELVPGSAPTNTDFWSTTPQEISAVAGLSTSGSTIGAIAAAYNQSADGNSGTVRLRTTWDLAAGTTYAAAEGTSWEYSFVADATGDFVMNYDGILVGTNTFGLNGFYLTGDLGAHYFTAGVDEQFVAGVLAGFTYTLHLSMNANLSGNGLDGYQGTMQGIFDWSLPGSASVPDAASTAAMMVFSVAGLLALRRKLVRA